MLGTVAEIQNSFQVDQLAAEISNLWMSWKNSRAKAEALWLETRNYIFATDTKSTTNSKLPWRNSTTLPKLCQIRDNLHANYMSTLIPNDNWLTWEAYTQDASEKSKRVAVQTYMSNKTRQGNFRQTLSLLLLDYIDKGNAICSTDYRKESYIDEDTQEEVIVFSGPVLNRWAPEDIVFNPLAPSFKQSPKITRSIKTVGDLYREMDENPDSADYTKVLKTRGNMAQYGAVDINKAMPISIDGFGSYAEYIKSDYVEILELFGDIYDKQEMKYKKKRLITVVDRTHVVRDVALPSWVGDDYFYHVGWRDRQDNLWSMGPLENLVGMQYRIDHLYNAVADATDLSVAPPLKIRGSEVEEFEWAPFTEIFVGENGDVSTVVLDLQGVFSGANQIQVLEAKMEEYSGAPREAMGIRSPGEKTAFEVQTLAQGASRIFQEKITKFEVQLLEPALNAMLEQSRRNLDGVDLIGVFDEDFGVTEFLEITRQDLKQKGKIRSLGARHFASQAQMVQNYQGFRQVFAADPGVMNHISGYQEAKLFEKLLGLENEGVVEKNIRIFEAAESQAVISQAQENQAVNDASPLQDAPPPEGPVA